MIWEKLQAMLAMDLGDYLKHREAREHLTVEFPVESVDNPGESPGYFQMRLCEMRLTDDRRWLEEIAPAALFVAAYHYDGKVVRHPNFISSTRVKELAKEGINGVLRIKFRDQLIFGPVPYAGGDVELLVSLCQVPLKDWSRAMFSVFESVLGGGETAGLSSYLKLAERLLGEISSCLGASGIQCLLAEQQAIGQQQMPTESHIAFIANVGQSIRKDKLRVKNDQLYEERDGDMLPFAAADYCLVKVELKTQRNDYTSMPFHQSWLTARQMMMDKRRQEAQVMMTDCANQVLRSPDLAEQHKFELIRLYQAKLIAIGDLLADLAQPAGLDRTRSGETSGQRLSSAYDEKTSLEIANGIHNLASRKELQSDAPLNENDIYAHLAGVAQAAKVSHEQALKLIAQQFNSP